MGRKIGSLASKKSKKIRKARAKANAANATPETIMAAAIPPVKVLTGPAAARKASKLGGVKKEAKSRINVPPPVSRVSLGEISSADDNDDEMRSEDEVEHDELDSSEALQSRDNNAVLKTLKTKEELQKHRSFLVRQHRSEQMALKRHITQMKHQRKQMAAKRGSARDSEREMRRQLGKYIRQLQEEQRQKHAKEMKELEDRLGEYDTEGRAFFKAAQKFSLMNSNNKEDAEPQMSEDELRSMFAQFL